MVQVSPQIQGVDAAGSPEGASISSPKAGFLFRMAAMMADQILLNIVGFFLGFLGGFFQIPQGAIFSVIFAFTFLYFWLSTGLTGTTLGKRLFKMAVVTKDGQPSLGKAFLRETIGKIFSSIPFSLGYFWALWDKDKQTWHDKISGTFVVQTETVGGGRKFLAYFLVLVVPILMILGIVGSVMLLAINPKAALEKAEQMRSGQTTIPYP